MTKKLPKQLVALINNTGLLPIEELQKLSPAKRIQHAAKGEQLQLIGLLYKGCALAGLKEQLDHGQFRKELSNVGLKTTDAYRAENAWQLSLRIKPSNVPTLVHLNPSKVYLLLSWKSEEVDSFLEGKRVHGITIDDAHDSSVREMEQLIKANANGMIDAQKKIDRLSQDNLVLTEEKLALKHQLNNKHDARFPDYVEMTRDESTALSSEIEFNIESMERLFHNLQDQVAFTKTDEDAKRFLQIAETSLYHNLNGAIGRAMQLLLTMQKQYSKKVTGTLTDSEIMFTAEEAKFAVNDREALLQLQKSEALIRADKRKSAKKKNKSGIK